jgi:16S rRNA (guanine527-N7)-methyltransferase
MSWDTNHYRDRFDEPSTSAVPALDSGARLLGVSLSTQTLAQFERFQRELIDWNQRINLTSITSPAEIERRHFLDSLSCIAGAPALFGRSECVVVDIGSGAGFPGLPIKLALPHVKLTLVETRGKRATFLRHLIDVLEIDGATVISDRAEVLGQDTAHRERYDVALARALGSLVLVAELCMPLVRIGGRCVAPRREDFETESKTAQPAFDQLGGSDLEWVPVIIPGLDDGRGLVVSEKQSATPARFPRRPGIPEKRPLA